MKHDSQIQIGQEVIKNRSGFEIGRSPVMTTTTYQQ
jgi:hypothetical protein